MADPKDGSMGMKTASWWADGWGQPRGSRKAYPTASLTVETTDESTAVWSAGSSGQM